MLQDAVLQVRAALARSPSVITGAFGSLGAAFGIQFSLLLSGVVTARVLGPEDRGHYALLALFPSVLSNLLMLGASSSLAYFVAKRPEHSTAILNSMKKPILAQAVLCTIAHAVILLMLLADKSSGYKLAGFLTLSMGPVFILQHYGWSYLQGQGAYRPNNILRLMGPLIYSGLLVLMVMLEGGSLLWVTALWCLANYLSLGATIIAVRNRLSLSPQNVSTTSAREVLSFGAKGFLGTAAPLESFRLDQFMVSALLTPAHMGFYVTSLSFTNLPKFIAQSLGIVALPHIASRPTSRSAIRSMWAFVLTTIIGTTMLVFVLIIAVPWLIPVLFGEDFREAIVPAQILLLATVFQAGRRILGDSLQALGFAGIGSIAEVATWVVTVPILLLLVNTYELNGVAIALCVGAFAGFIVVATKAVVVHLRRDTADEMSAGSV